VIVVVLLCGVVFFVFRRYRKVLHIAESHKAQEREMQIVKSNDIEEQIARIVTKNLMNRKVGIDKTMYSEGENCNAEYGKFSQLKVGEVKNERTETQAVSDQTVDFRFALNKVNSEL